MKNMLITISIVIIILLVAALGYLRYVTKKTPSIMGGGYDAEMKAKNEGSDK